MPPRKIMPQQRSVLTRSMSLNCSQRHANDTDTWFSRVEDDGRVEKRVGMTTCKMAFRNGKLAPARIESMKNLFANLDMADKKITTPDAKCDYCKSEQCFFYDDSSTCPPKGICTCTKAEEGSIARLLPRRAISRIQSYDGNIHETIVLEEEFTKWSGPIPCRVVNRTTGLEWRPKPGGRISVVLRAPAGLQYWSIAGTMHGRVVYIFGYNHNGSWRYATAKFGRHNRVDFARHSTNPSELEIDTNAPITDPRAFSIHGSGRDMYLSPTSNANFVVKISGHRTLALVSDRRSADRWDVSS